MEKQTKQEKKQLQETTAEEKDGTGLQQDREGSKKEEKVLEKEPETGAAVLGAKQDEAGAAGAGFSSGEFSSRAGTETTGEGRTEESFLMIVLANFSLPFSLKWMPSEE